MTVSFRNSCDVFLLFLYKSGSSKRISLLFLARKCAKRRKCISTNPPSSAFSPFGDRGSHSYFLGEKIRNFNLHCSYSSIDFPQFGNFTYIFPERVAAGLGWKTVKMQILEECNISHKVNGNWNVIFEQNQFLHRITKRGN